MLCAQPTKDKVCSWFLKGSKTIKMTPNLSLLEQYPLGSLATLAVGLYLAYYLLQLVLKLVLPILLLLIAGGSLGWFNATDANTQALSSKEETSSVLVSEALNAPTDLEFRGSPKSLPESERRTPHGPPPLTIFPKAEQTDNSPNAPRSDRYALEIFQFNDEELAFETCRSLNQSDQNGHRHRAEIVKRDNGQYAIQIKGPTGGFHTEGEALHYREVHGLYQAEVIYLRE